MTPFAWFTPKVSDADYAPKFQAALHMIQPFAKIMRGMPKADDVGWEASTAWSVQRITDLLAALTQSHNALVDVKPRRQLMGLHRALIKTTKAYGWALKDRADADRALLDGGSDWNARYRHHLKHGAQWDVLARENSKRVVRHLEKLSASAPDIYALIIGDHQLAEGLAECADDDITGETIFYW